MRRFTDLFIALDETNKTSAKLQAMTEYFSHAAPEDAAWALYFLSGRRINRLVKTGLLRAWAAEMAEVPDWLFDESYYAAGDMAETMALLLPPPEHSTERPLHQWVEQDLLGLLRQTEEGKRETVQNAWRQMDAQQRFVWNKLMTSGFRVGVSLRNVTKAIAAAAGIDDAVIAHRLMGHWEPTPDFYRQLLAAETGEAVISRPYPFYLAYPFTDELPVLGAREEYQVEWKWDGIRSQLIRREGQTFLWSRGEDLITERFPEVEALSEGLPDGVALDGELLAWKDGAVMPFGMLQRRIGRKVLGKKILSDVPVIFMAYDLLEAGNEDIRLLPLSERRARLEQLVTKVNHASMLLSPIVQEPTWEALAETRRESRERRVEGFMLKRLDAPYRVGRQRGDWWKWKIDPYSVDCVLIYAQRGSGKRASLYTDYTFGIWAGKELVPFAKAYSGLTDEEIRKVDSFVRRNTLEKFGPVRAVKQELVFELGFEGIQKSTRHRSGVAVRFPRMLHWRTDKKAEDADTIETIQALISE